MPYHAREMIQDGRAVGIPGDGSDEQRVVSQSMENFRDVPPHPAVAVGHCAFVRPPVLLSRRKKETRKA